MEQWTASMRSLMIRFQGNATSYLWSFLFSLPSFYHVVSGQGSHLYLDSVKKPSKLINYCDQISPYRKEIMLKVIAEGPLIACFELYHWSISANTSTKTSPERGANVRNEGLTLETSAFESPYSGQFTLSTQFTVDKTKLSCNTPHRRSTTVS